jgi:hypothetical protein
MQEVSGSIPLTSTTERFEVSFRNALTSFWHRKKDFTSIKKLYRISVFAAAVEELSEESSKTEIYPSFCPLRLEA